jgi:hypothetical protein
MAARHQRINGDALAGLEGLHLRTDFHHRGAKFMPKYLRESDDLGTDSPLSVVVDIGTAHAQGINPQ